MQIWVETSAKGISSVIHFEVVIRRERQRCVERLVQTYISYVLMYIYIYKSKSIETVHSSRQIPISAYHSPNPYICDSKGKVQLVEGALLANLGRDIC